MPLIDTNLVVRYYLDEAASGQAPTTIADASANAFDLTDVNYGSTNMNWTEVSGQRGLVCTSTTGTQRARRTINDTSDAVRDAMAGVQQATIEIVIDYTAGHTSGGRIFGIGDRVGNSGRLMLRNATNSSNWQLIWNDAGTFTFSNATSGRHVLTVVIDSTQATQNDRVRISINGGTLAQVSNTMALNSTLSLPAGLDLIMFNRESSGSWDRSMQMTLFYAAMYATALSQTDISDNATILGSDDDTPVGGTVKDLAGDAAAAAAAAAQLAIDKALAGSALAAGAATGDVLLLKFLLAAASGQAVAAGDMGLAKLLGSAAAAGATATGQLQGGATITTPPLKNNTGTVLASESGATVLIYSTAGALVATKTGQTTNGSGVMVVSDPALVAATSYRLVIILASGAEGMETLTAA